MSGSITDSHIRKTSVPHKQKREGVETAGMGSDEALG